MSNNRNKALKCLKFLEEMEKLEELEEIESEEEKEEIKKRFWVNPFLEKRDEMAHVQTILKDLLYSSEEFQNFGRLPLDKFEELLNLVGPQIQKQNTNMRYSIPANIRLALTLRFIATGDSFKSLEILSRISRKTIGKFVPEVLDAIYNVLQPLYMKLPENEQEWLEIADDFQRIWQFPHVLGALDGKHIRIIAPADSGSLFYNFKGFFSIVLFAMVDAHGRFTYINVGANGKTSDSTIYRNSVIHQCLQQKTLNIPKPTALSSQTRDIPYFFIGDDAFALDSTLMKPFNRNLSLSVPQEIFNYRLCRARMTVEMAFGRLVSRFRIFNRPIQVAPATTDLIIQACCVLHNYLTKKRTAPVVSDELLGEHVLGEHITPIASQHSSNNPRLGNRIREKLSIYCINEGDVPFQWSKINRAQN